MNKRFILCVEYGTGKSGMIVNTPDLYEALEKFLKKCKQSLPDSKDFGLPCILKAEILPIIYESEFDDEIHSKEMP